MQLLCGEILIAIYCEHTQIIRIMASNGSMHCSLIPIYKNYEVMK